MRKVMYLIRGLPGSGKTTVAVTIATAISTVLGEDEVEHFEADDYFTNEVTGEYKFVASQLPQAHAECQEMTDQAMEDGVQCVIVSNTFTTKEEMKPYLDMANKYGYSVHPIICKGDFKSVHNVPEMVIDKMRARFEYE